MIHNAGHSCETKGLCMIEMKPSKRNLLNGKDMISLSQKISNGLIIKDNDEDNNEV